MTWNLPSPRERKLYESRAGLPRRQAQAHSKHSINACEMNERWTTFDQYQEPGPLVPPLQVISCGLGITKTTAFSFSLTHLVYQQVLPPLPSRYILTPPTSHACTQTQAPVTSAWMVALASSRSPGHGSRLLCLSGCPYCSYSIPDVPATLASSNISSQTTHQKSLFYSAVLQTEATAPEVITLKIHFS